MYEVLEYIDYIAHNYLCDLRWLPPLIMRFWYGPLESVSGYKLWHV